MARERAAWRFRAFVAGLFGTVALAMGLGANNFPGLIQALR